MPLVALLAIGVCPVPVQANTILFATGSINLAGQPVNATARFDVNAIADTITISMVNLQNNPISVGQLISGVSFTLSHLASTSPTATIVTERATEIEIDRMGRVTEVDARMDTDWKVLPVATNRYDLCQVCNGSGDPDNLLIGGPASNGKYASANGSIAGNSSHNPFFLASGATYTTGALAGVDSTPYWTIRMSGVQPITSVGNVTFRFGTTYGALTAPGENLTATPEPGTWVTMGGACMTLFAIWRKKKAAPGRS
jgi:hypothetical protein